MAKVFGFPNPVNETSARIVATGAVLMSVLFVVTGNPLVLVPLTYGFITEVITPRVKRDHVLVAGPPKRFAQGIGAAFCVTASVLWILDLHTASRVVIALLAGAASLEAFVGFCLGCAIFSRLMRWGVIPQSVCEDCNDISARLNAAQ